MKSVKKILYYKAMIDTELLSSSQNESLLNREGRAAARFVATARFVTKVTKRAAMPACFVTNEVVTNRAGIAPFFF